MHWVFRVGKFVRCRKGVLTPVFAGYAHVDTFDRRICPPYGSSVRIGGRRIAHKRTKRVAIACKNHVQLAW